MDFYTKSEIDEKFGVTISSPSWRDLYTKTEIESNVGTPETLVLPANMLDFYTKTEIDSIPTVEFMPHMDGILCYFDCNDGITTNNLWVNRIPGGPNATILGSSIHTDGAVALSYGNSSYGTFNCDTGYNTTMYVLFRATSVIQTNNYNYVLGSIADGHHFPRIDGPGSYWISGVGFLVVRNLFTEAPTFQCDVINDIIRDETLSYTDYHVVCFVRQKNGSTYDNAAYIDGVYIGSITGTPYPAGTHYGLSVGVDSFGYYQYTAGGGQNLYKFVGLGNVAHTEQQIIANSTWLRDHFNVN